MTAAATEGWSFVCRIDQSFKYVGETNALMALMVLLDVDIHRQ